MEYRQRKYPQLSACGLNCGLCPRYHSAGVSKCPGCAGADFLSKHPSCGIISCCERREIEYCYECTELPCKKYDGAAQSDSFITHLNQLSDMEKAKRIGLDAYAAELDERIAILEKLLGSCDDGRRKSFFCTAVNLLELQDIQSIMSQLSLDVLPEKDIKKRAQAAVRLFQEAAEQCGISLKLRRK